MITFLSDAELASLHAAHIPTAPGFRHDPVQCQRCLQLWPCQIRRLLAMLDRPRFGLGERDGKAAAQAENQRQVQAAKLTQERDRKRQA